MVLHLQVLRSPGREVSTLIEVVGVVLVTSGKHWTTVCGTKRIIYIKVKGNRKNNK